jgi:hypothetical protein
LNPLAEGFVALVATVLMSAPRRTALLMLIVGTCYIPFYMGFELGGFNFTAIRVLTAVGIARVIIRREVAGIPGAATDRLMLVWSAWLLASSAFHREPSAALIYRLGLVYDALGIYLLVRCFCRSLDDVTAIGRMLVVAIVPLALAMLYQKLTDNDPFSILGGVGDHSLVREGKIRANGPFGHPILAGTVGGTCLPLALSLWRSHRMRAWLGILSSATIVWSSASSGPILAAAAGVFGLYLWRYRLRMRSVQRLAIATYILLDLVMKDPAYFIIARVDLAGGSTSWYRARLIQSAFEHLSEWWLAGTDYTRHWMQVVVPWSPDHTDIASHYIQLGVWAGLPLILLFIATLFSGFAAVGRAVGNQSTFGSDEKFAIWSVGAALFALAVSGLSCSYFDQSFVFVYLMLGALASVPNLVAATPVAAVIAPVAPALGSRFSNVTPTRIGLSMKKPAQGR